MRSIVAIAVGLAVCGNICGCGAKPDNRGGKLPAGRKLDLYSWQTSPGGAWQFALLPHDEKHPDRTKVLAASAGDIDALRERLAAQGGGASILWFARPAGAGDGAAIFGHPPQKVIDEVGYAAQHRNLALFIEQEHSGP